MPCLSMHIHRRLPEYLQYSTNHFFGCTVVGWSEKGKKKFLFCLQTQ